jgi:ligand-binding sensor domain-containing protein
LKTSPAKGFCSFILLLFLNGVVLGQSPNLTFQKLSTKDGLLSNFVSAITTDAKGYLWVATRRGLCRYDGYTFRKIPESQTGAVNSLSHLPNGSLAVYWNNAGLFIVDQDGQSITPVDSVDFTDPDPVNDHFNNLFTDSQGNLWSSSYGLIRRYEIATKKHNQYTIKGTDQTGEGKHFFEDHQHRLWILSERGLYRFDRKKNSIYCVLGPEAANSANRKTLQLSAIAEDNTGNLWLGTPNDGLFQYQPDQETLQHYPISGQIRSLAFVVDSSGTTTLWLGCDDGLKIFQPTLATSITVDGLQGVSVQQISPDTGNGIVWLATNDGLWQYRSGISAIQTVLLPESITQKAVTVTAILPDSADTYWLGLSHSGVLRWNRATNAFKLYRYPVDAVTNNLSWVKGTLWAATDHGIFQLNTSAFKAVNLPSRFSSPSIQKVLTDRHQRVWVLHKNEGIQVFDLNTLRPITLWNEQKARELWATNRYHDLAESPDGRIWIAAWYPKSFGMIGYNERERRLQELADFNIHKQFIGDYFTRVSVGKQGRMLFAGGGGVNTTDANGKIDSLRSVYSGLTPELADDQCFGVAEDNGNRLWIGTGEGLHTFNPATRLIRRFTEVDGLLSDDATNGFAITPNDLLLVGQQNGFNLIDINRLHQPTPLPPLTIASMQVNGQYKPVVLTKPLLLANSENDLRFTFTTLSFGPVSTIRFRYKLTDRSGWINLGITNEINLTNLKSGDYTLVVQNGDDTGRWNQNGITIQFEIAPAWYETGLFRGLVLLGLLGLLYGFYRMRIGQERRRSELTRQRAEAETRALRAQMNPHFIFNCMNTIDAYILTNRPDAASIFLQKFSRLVRQVLENSRETLIPIKQELETLTLYIELEEERADHRFSHTFSIDPTVETCLMPPLLLQPFVENAILHGLRHKTDWPGVLIVSIQQTENQLRCRVEDNGIGRAKAAAIHAHTGARSHQSLGSKVTTERVDSLQALYGTEASYSIMDQNPVTRTGTIVDIKLPLIRQ